MGLLVLISRINRKQNKTESSLFYFLSNLKYECIQTQILSQKIFRKFYLRIKNDNSIKEALTYCRSFLDVHHIYMVKFREDAYWRGNLSLFIISFEHYWVLNAQKNLKTCCFLGPLFYGSVVLIDVLCYSYGFKRYRFLHFFQAPCKTKFVLKYCLNMGQNYGCQISSWFCSLGSQ